MGFDQVDEFLRKKGAVEVIVEIGRGSATYQDINEAVLVSPSTVSNRLNEAVKADLIEVTHRPTDYGTQKRYTLTDSGQRIHAWVLNIDLEKKIRELRRIQRDRDNKMEQLLSYVNRDMTLLKSYFEPERRVTEEELERLSSEDDYTREEVPGEIWEQKRHERLHDSLMGESEDENSDQSGDEGGS